MALPNLYLLKLHPFPNRSKHFICGLSDHQIDFKYLLIYKYAESIFFFFLPAVIQVRIHSLIYTLIEQILLQTILYMIICQKIFFIDRAIQYSSLIPSQVPMKNLARKKAILMLLIIAMFYFLAFSPTQINFLYTQIQHAHHLYEHRLFFVITILLALSSTAINPILFYIFSKFFRMEFNRILQVISSRMRRRQEEGIPMH